jgi:hypothetical protein
MLIELDINDRLGRKVNFVVDKERRAITGVWIEENPYLPSMPAADMVISGKDLYEFIFGTRILERTTKTPPA